MKYTYAYKTPDGARHQAAMEASSRDEVFAALRQQGIKAIKVVAEDGAKANGEIRGVRKRVVVSIAAILVLCAISAALVAFHVGEIGGFHEASAMIDDTARRQVIGDVAIVDKGIRTGWSDVFELEGDRFLASFAIPGVKVGVKQTSVDALQKALASSVLPKDEDRLEVRQIKAMVEGMKTEARAYVAAGGTLVDYGKRLIERQEAEIAIYKRTETELLAAQKNLGEQEFYKLFDQRNDELRNLGIRPVTIPD